MQVNYEPQDRNAQFKVVAEKEAVLKQSSSKCHNLATGFRLVSAALKNIIFKKTN